MRRILKVLRLWPIAAAIYFICGFNLYVIFGILKKFGVTGPEYWLSAIACSEGELCFWYWFCGWAPRMIKEADVVQELIDDFKTEGLPWEFQALAGHAKRVAQVTWTWVRARIIRHLDSRDTGQGGWVTSLIYKSLAPVAYLLVYFLGSIPTWNTVAGIPLCRNPHLRLRFAFGVLLLGNINTVLVTGGVLELVLWLWRVHPVLLCGGAALVAVWVFVRRSTKKT